MRMSEEDYDRVMNVNMKSVFNMTKARSETYAETKKWFNNKYEFCSGGQEQRGSV